MDSAQFNLIMSLFQEACGLPDPQRREYLDVHCVDAEVRREVEALLRHDARPSPALAAPGAGAQLLALQLSAANAPTLPASSVSSHPRVLAGQYRIIRIIGEGGMGVVYEAEQARPRRRVALKAIRAGMASRQMLRRFEREAHILGRLHHPNIAQIYEAGVGDETESDHAYFVMELVEGLPMTEHAARRNLDTRTRLELMARVCDAVQYAHQRGVIHRDLKPGNVLVTVGGEPKILDFGVARYVEDDTTASLQTLSGQLMGTLPYMSPEQVCGNPDEIDTRVDVYALGVMLYHLLSGELPFDLKNRSIAEAARIIRDETPRRLSDHRRELAGDVETMVQRAIEREPSRRYQSAADLAADLRRHLAGEPIVARSDALLYVLRKRLWRRRGRVLAAACIAGLLLALIIVIRQQHHAPRPPSLPETSRYLQAMITACRARDAGDKATWEKTIAYLKEELQTDEPHVIALIDETLQPLFPSKSSPPAAGNSAVEGKD